MEATDLNEAWRAFRWPEPWADRAFSDDLWPVIRKIGRWTALGLPQVDPEDFASDLVVKEWARRGDRYTPRPKGAARGKPEEEELVEFVWQRYEFKAYVRSMAKTDAYDLLRKYQRQGKTVSSDERLLETGQETPSKAAFFEIPDFNALCQLCERHLNLDADDAFLLAANLRGVPYEDYPEPLQKRYKKAALAPIVARIKDEVRDEFDLDFHDDSAVDNRAILISGRDLPPEVQEFARSWPGKSMVIEEVPGARSIILATDRWTAIWRTVVAGGQPCTCWGDVKRYLQRFRLRLDALDKQWHTRGALVERLGESGIRAVQDFLAVKK